MFHLRVDVQDTEADEEDTRTPPGPRTYAEAAQRTGTGDGGRGGDRDRVSCFSGNPHVEVTQGVIHLYREDVSGEETKEKCDLLCIVAVPSYISGSDLCQFVAPFQSFITHMRVVRDNSPNKYMVLMKFSAHTHASEFLEEFNGKRFSSLDSEICHVMRVTSVEFQSPGGVSSRFPSPNTGQTELPTCPVCLERLDPSISGILTILCNHSFHCSCLSNWGDSTCPVCRYCQNPETKNKCMECDSEANLWICLICGHVGCGRYLKGHAYDHYEATKHTYSMELETQRVWDYAGDGYVHRLIQNKTDGKLVELPDPRSRSDRRLPRPTIESDRELDEKLESVSMEYNYLLASQLETQRVFYEEQINKVNSVYREELSRCEAQVQELGKDRAIKAEQIRVLDVEKRVLERKLQASHEKGTGLTKELGFLKEVNASLIENQKDWQEMKKRMEEAVAGKDARIQELEEQIRDLMVHFEAQRTIGENDDLGGGSVLPSRPAEGARRKGRRGEKKQ